jgi:hypothetical protein
LQNYLLRANPCNSRRAACTQRHLAFSRDAWHFECHCACRSEWNARCCSGCCDKYIRRWGQVPHLWWTALLALPGCASVWTLWAVKVSSCKSERGEEEAGWPCLRCVQYKGIYGVSVGGNESGCKAPDVHIDSVLQYHEFVDMIGGHKSSGTAGFSAQTYVRSSLVHHHLVDR